MTMKIPEDVTQDQKAILAKRARRQVEEIDGESIIKKETEEVLAERRVKELIKEDILRQLRTDARRKADELKEIKQKEMFGTE